MDAKLRRHLEQALREAAAAADAAPGPRLVDDARRLWARVGRLLEMGLVDVPADGPERDAQRDALELACFALHLPFRQARPGGPRPANPAAGRSVGNLRDRCEEAAEALIVEAGSWADDALLDRTARLLREAPHRPPMLDDAKVLADAVNLEDFGVVGLVQQVMQLARLGQGVGQLADGLEKREQYGYWDARLNDGFHFAPVREQARRRLEHARQAAALLKEELADDGG